MENCRLYGIEKERRSKRHLQEKNCVVCMKALCHCLMISFIWTRWGGGGGWIRYKYAIFDIFRIVCLSLYLQGYTLTFWSIKSIMMMRRAEAEWMDGKRGDKKGGKSSFFPFLLLNSEWMKIFFCYSYFQLVMIVFFYASFNWLSHSPYRFPNISQKSEKSFSTFARLAWVFWICKRIFFFFLFRFSCIYIQWFNVLTHSLFLSLWLIEKLEKKKIKFSNLIEGNSLTCSRS